MASTFEPCLKITYALQKIICESNHNVFCSLLPLSFCNTVLKINHQILFKIKYLWICILLTKVYLGKLRIEINKCFKVFRILLICSIKWIFILHFYFYTWIWVSKSFQVFLLSFSFTKAILSKNYIWRILSFLYLN